MFTTYLLIQRDRQIHIPNSCLAAFLHLRPWGPAADFRCEGFGARRTVARGAKLKILSRMHLPSSPIAQDSKIELNLLHRSTTISVCRWVRPRPEFYDIDKTARVNSNFVVGQKIVPRGRSPRPSRPNFVHHPKATRQWSTDGI
jgi:hypothetical protein